MGYHFLPLNITLTMLKRILTGFVETATIVMMAYTAPPSDTVTTKLMRNLTVYRQHLSPVVRF